MERLKILYSDIKEILKNKNGSVFAWSLFLVVFGLSSIIITVEIMRVNDIVRTVRSGMEQTTDAIVSDYLDENYFSKRDSNNGAFIFEEEDFRENLQTIDVESYLQEHLDVTKLGDEYTNILEGEINYYLNNLDIIVKNGKINTPNDVFSVTSEAKLNTFIRALGQEIPFDLDLNVKSKFTQLY